MLYRNTYSDAKSVKQLHRDIWQMIVDGFVYGDEYCYCEILDPFSEYCEWVVL